jgi:arylsulfatase A-like enzyme
VQIRKSYARCRSFSKILVSPIIFSGLLLLSCNRNFVSSHDYLDKFRVIDLKGWNVVLVTIDAVDSQRMGCYGGKKEVTPFLDSLAKEGLLVEYAYCPTGSTAPSHASMFTALFPERHGCRHNASKINPDTWNFPTALLEQGYDTLGWTWAFFMNENNNFSKGFKHYFIKPNLPGKRISLLSNQDDFKQFREFFLKSRLRSPFFIWFHLKGGHSPLIPIDPKYMKRHGIIGSPETLPVPPIGVDEESAYAAEGNSKVENNSPYLAQLKGYYDSNLSEMDDTLKSLFEFLRSRDKMKNTLFVIVADHGETFENGIIGQHWPSPYESTMRIPMIFWTVERDIFSGERITNRLASTVDIAPTLLNLLGLRDQLPINLDGINLFDTRRKRYTLQGSSVSTYEYEYIISQLKDLQINNPDVPKENIIKEVWTRAKDEESQGLLFYVYYQYDPLSKNLMKLIYTQVRPNKKKFGTPPTLQLFNLTHDPHESLDLVGMNPKLDSMVNQMYQDLKHDRPLIGWTTNLIEALGTFTEVVGTGDFNDDGKTDILFRDKSTGDLGVWTMNDTTITGSVGIGKPQIEWEVVGTGDFNGDGKTDILFRNKNTGDVGVWTMDDTTITGWVGIGKADIEWDVFPKSAYPTEGLDNETIERLKSLGYL